MDVFQWPEQKEEIVEYYMNRDSKDSVKKIAIFFFRQLNKDCLDSAEKMLRGLFSTPGYGTFHYGNKINWSSNPSHSISYMRILHAHFFISDLIIAYLTNGEEKYLHFGYQLIEDWIRKNPKSNPSHSMAWHDEVTARRLVVWISFFDHARKTLGKKQVSLLLEKIFSHAKLLSTNKFHSTNTNHGMFQDESLLVFSEYFNHVNLSRSYRQLAQKRLKNYFKAIISSEGVHLEHSPSYHQIIANSLLKYSKFFDSIQSNFTEYLSNNYYKMADFATHILKPDGTWPLIGDTFLKDRPSGSLWVDDPMYQFAVSKGSHGIKPEKTEAIYPKSGYAVFRNSWKTGEKGIYILFHAAFHTLYHKHNDDLGLCVYADGDIIVEAGPNGYDYKNPYTQYAYSSFAHNTLIVDNFGLKRDDKKYNKTFLLRWGLDVDCSFVSGINERYKGVKHVRMVKYIKSKNKIEVTDNITSEDKHNYKLLWHLAPGVTPVLEKKQIGLIRGQEKVMQCQFASSSTLSIKTVYGQKDPFLLGWYFLSIQHPIPIYTLIIEFNTRSTEIKAEFEILI